MLRMTHRMEGTGTNWTVGSFRHYQAESEASQRLWLDPPFQRGSVWTPAQRIAWIETILDGLPRPPIVLEEVWDWDRKAQAAIPGHEWSIMIIDGRQRLEATFGFMSDAFAVRGEFFGQQSEVFRRKFDGEIIPVIKTRMGNLRACAELYVRLLTAGTAHTPAEIQAAADYLNSLP